MAAEAQTSAQSDPQSERQPRSFLGLARVYRRSSVRFHDGPAARQRMVISFHGDQARGAPERECALYHLRLSTLIRAPTRDCHIRAGQKIVWWHFYISSLSLSPSAGPPGDSERFTALLASLQPPVRVFGESEDSYVPRDGSQRVFVSPADRRYQRHVSSRT